MKQYIFLGLMLFTKTSFCQLTYPTKYHAMNFIDRTVAVQLDVKEPNFETTIKEMVSKYWKLPNKVEFMTESQIKDLLKDKTKETTYAVMSFGTRQEAGHIRSSGRIVISEVYNVSIYLADMAGQLNRYEIDWNRGDGVIRGAYVFGVSLPYFPTSNADYKFIFKQFNDYINYCQTDKYTYDAKYKPSKSIGQWALPFNKEKVQALEQKTLLIPQEMLSVSEDSIKLIYKFPFEVKPYKDIQEYLNNDSNTKYAYFLPAWNDHKNNYYLFVVDETGTDLTEIPMQTNPKNKFSIFGGPTFVSSFDLTNESFKQLSDNIVSRDNKY